MENLNPEVSIALCTYNGDRFLKEQIISILNQDYANITEIVCIDDNSSDNTWNILKEFSHKKNIFKISQNFTNIGYIKNFEKAILMCKAQFIAIADQDDIWQPNKISKLVKAIGSNLMVYSDNNYIDVNGHSLGIKSSDIRNISACENCLSFAFFNVISGHTMLINRNLLNHAVPFNSEIPYDLWLAFHAAQYSKIAVVNEPLVRYRLHDNNTLGVLGINNNDKNITKEDLIKASYNRLKIFSENLSAHLTKEKKVFELLAKSYYNKSIIMRLIRVAVFLRYKDDLLLFRKRTKVRKLFYCFKVFWKYQ